jgi:pimeloyl-ACP methyl ester carboxylesterase
VSAAGALRRRQRRWLLWSALLALGVGALFWLDRRLTSAALFLRFERSEAAPAWLAHYGERAVTTRPWRLPWGHQGRLYEPEGGASRGLLLVHGMHPGGIDEPRLTQFAQALASTGVVVGTPEFADLRQFTVSRQDVVTVAEAARQLARELGTTKVTVFGVSFGGGLALRAACEPKLAGGIGRLIALGAPEDLVRVSHFALGEPVRGPSGELFPLKPHAYATKAVRSFLLGAGAASVSEGPALTQLLQQTLALRTPELNALSPAACTQRVAVPVHLVHGLGDNVIPYTETLWLARRLPAKDAPEVLVSPAISHADYAPPTPWQRFQLVEFMAKAADW